MVGSGSGFESAKDNWNANVGSSMSPDEFLAAHRDKFANEQQANDFMEMTLSNGRGGGRAAIEMKTVTDANGKVSITGIKQIATVAGVKAKVMADSVARTERALKTKYRKAGTQVSDSDIRKEAINRVSNKAGKNLEKVKSERKAAGRAKSSQNLKQNKNRKAKLDGAS
jgi:hypothetical protein